MEQITREEMIGLLREHQQLLVRHGHPLIEVIRADNAITALQAVEPAGYGLKGLFTKQWDGKTFVEKEDADSYEEAALLPLFTLPCPPAKAQIPIGEVIEEMSSDPEFIKGLEDGRRRIREAKAQVPGDWREELETIAEILEADGDEWNCAARIRKMLAAAPAPDHIPDTEKMAEALKGLLAIISDSRGVDGYHLNGDIAEWDEFEEVGFAEDVYAAYIQQKEAER